MSTELLAIANREKEDKIRGHIKSLLNKTKEDAPLMLYQFGPSGTFKRRKQAKSSVEQLLKKDYPVTKHPGFDDVFMLNQYNGISGTSLVQSISYETKDVNNFTEYKAKNNPYFNIYTRLDDSNRTIEFKLGERDKTLEIIENGRGRPFCEVQEGKYLICCDLAQLKNYINNPVQLAHFISMGRECLNIRTNFSGGEIKNESETG